MTYYKGITVTGVINTLTNDAGLNSTESEPKTLKKIFLSVSRYLNNIVEVWLEREKIAEIYDYVLDTYELNAATFSSRSVTKTLAIDLDVKIPVGQTLTTGIRCGGVASNLSGAYQYEIGR